MKSMWNIVKTEMETKCHNNTVPSVIENDDLVTNPDQAADAFINFHVHGSVHHQ
jgi:hypothetical protein